MGCGERKGVGESYRVRAHLDAYPFSADGALTVLREEIITGMQLMGVTSLDQLRPELVQYVDRDPPARTR